MLFTWQVTTWFRWTALSQTLDQTVYEESASTFEYLKQRQGLSRAMIVTEKLLVSGFAHKLSTCAVVMMVVFVVVARRLRGKKGSQRVTALS